MSASPVKIAVVSPAFVYFPLWIAERRGLFARRDLECQVVEIGTTDGVTSAVEAGETHLAVSAAEGFALRTAAGSPIPLVAGNANRAPLRLVADPAIRTVEGLRGKRVGTSSLREGTATIIKTMLAAHGLGYPNDYEFVLAGAHPQRWDALQAGEIDACLQLIPYDYIAEDSGYAVLSAASDYVPDYAFSAVAANLGWAEANPDVVNRILDALREAMEWAADHRDLAADIIDGATGAGGEHAARGLDYMLDHEVVPTDLHIDRKALDAVFAAMQAAGLVAEGALSYELCVDERFARSG